jgi:hypothetical protein
LAAAEPMNRSRKLDMSSTETSSNGAGSSIARSTSAPSMARIGPSRDQLNMATKCAAKNTKGDVRRERPDAFDHHRQHVAVAPDAADACAKGDARQQEEEKKPATSAP